jgi:predicted O-methyltransferase YrrM
MTTRDKTSAWIANDISIEMPLRDRAMVGLYGAIQWPWLLRSLWGGRKADKRALLDRLALPGDALPHLGSWKADTRFLCHIVDAVETLRPRNVVELGCGASSLIIARALDLYGGGRLTSYDQHSDFVAATSAWIAGHGLSADVHAAPLGEPAIGWGGHWYQLRDVPAAIDLLVIDGPPWAIHPFVRGSAESLFARLTPGAMILLDDAARPGERVVARRWLRNWPGIRFRYDATGSKGTLIGRVDEERAV